MAGSPSPVAERVPALASSVDRAAAAAGPTVLRLVAALLWLSNVSWKVPPGFGRSGDSCRGLCGFLNAGADSGVLPGSAWVFRELVVPNLSAVGWLTLFVEASLAAALLAGRFVRTAAVVGMVQSAGVGLAVANADGEWYWSYALMVVLHLAILATARSARPTTTAAALIGLAAYGAVVAAAHTGGFTDTAFTLFDQGNDFPGDFGRNVFPGSVALGLLLAAVALGVALVRRARPRAGPTVGVVLVAAAAVALLGYDRSGLLVGLGSRASTAAVVAGVGLVLIDRGRPAVAAGTAR